MKTFSDKDPAEKIFVVFDFSKIITDKVESISGVSFSVTVATGVDASPSAILSGSPILKPKEASHLITGGVNGVSYIITCTADTTRGQRLKGIATLPVKDQA